MRPNRAMIGVSECLHPIRFTTHDLPCICLACVAQCALLLAVPSASESTSPKSGTRVCDRSPDWEGDAMSALKRISSDIPVICSTAAISIRDLESSSSSSSSLYPVQQSNLPFQHQDLSTQLPPTTGLPPQQHSNVGPYRLHFRNVHH